MDKIPLYLIPLIVAIACAPMKTASSLTNIYRVQTWDLSTSGRSWRQRLTSAVRAVGQFLWGHRQGLAVAALIGLMLCAPDTLRAHGLAVCAVGSIAQLEADLKAKTAEVRGLDETIRHTCETHEEKDAAGKVIAIGRERTKEERASVEAKLDECRTLKARIEARKSDDNMLAELDRITEGMQAAQPQRIPGAPGRGVIKSLGQAFIDSETYAWLKKNPSRGGKWQSASAELPGLAEISAATLTEASGGAALLVPEFRPGILEFLQRPLAVADLIAPGTTENTSITYMVESAPTNAAATVAEGAQKPESTLVFTSRNDVLSVIATWLPVTNQMLEDVPAIRSYIDNRLRGFVQTAEDDQILNGDGIAPNLLGIRNRVGIAVDVVRGADTNVDAIFKQMTAILVNAFIQVDATVLHPTNWMTIALSKDANGQYYGQGPFAGPGPRMLWGYPVAVTTAMTLGVALPGAYRMGAQLFRKGGLTVTASNSHNDYFTKNLTAILAEERAALAVYRPGGFGEVTGLN